MNEFTHLRELLSSTDKNDRKEGLDLLFGDSSKNPKIYELIETLDEDQSFAGACSDIIFRVPRNILFSKLSEPLQKIDSESFRKFISILSLEDSYEYSSFMCNLFYDLESGNKKKMILDNIAGLQTLPPDPGREIVDYYLENNDFLETMDLLLSHPSVPVREKGIALLSATGSPKAGSLYAQSFIDDESSDFKLKWIKLLKKFSNETALDMVAAVSYHFTPDLYDDMNVVLKEIASNSPDLYLDFLERVKENKDFFSKVTTALKGIIDLDYLPQIVNSVIDMKSLEARKAFFQSVESIVNYHQEKIRLTADAKTRELCLRELSKLLRSKDRSVRHGATDLMIRFGGEGILKVVTMYMDTEDESDREYLEEYFSKTPPTVLIPRLMTVEGADNRQQTALLRLVKSTKDSGFLTYVLDVLACEDPGVRAYAIKCAESLGDTSDYRNYCRDEKEHVRYWSCYILRNFPSERSLKLLKERLVDPSMRIRGVAVESLGFLSFPEVLRYLEEAFDDPEDEVREKAIDALGSIGSQESLAILQKSVGKFSNQRLKDKMVSYVTAKRKKMLLDNFGQIPLEHRDTVAKSIYRLDRKLLADLREKMASLDPDIRYRAAEILCSITDKGDLAIIPLLHKAASDPDKKIRALITEALGKSGDKTSYRVLLKLLNDPNDRVRANVIESLEKYGKKEEVIALLVPFLEDSNNRVRANTIIALWNLGYRNVWNALKSLLDSDDGIYIASGLFALRKIEFKGPYDFLKKFFSRDHNIMKYNLLLTCEELGLVNLFRSDIRKMLKDDETRISQKALELLEE